jgi:hypothetical protein
MDDLQNRKTGLIINQLYTMSTVITVKAIVKRWISLIKIMSFWSLRSINIEVRSLFQGSFIRVKVIFIEFRYKSGLWVPTKRFSKYFIDINRPYKK